MIHSAFTCVGICILNYNNGLKTVHCIESILDQPFKDYRIIIIDNHSTDDSVNLITNFLEHQAIRFTIVPEKEIINPAVLIKSNAHVFMIRSEVNGGYSRGNNLGMNLAKSLGIFSHLLILNNDLVLTPEFLGEITKHFRRLQEEIGYDKVALGATELDMNGKITHRGFHYLHIPTALPFNFPLFPSFKYIVGSCIFVDIDAPLMDECYFLYLDDTEYSKILLKNSYMLASCESARYLHEVGGTTRHDTQVYKTVYKSLKRFYILHYPVFLVSAILVRMPVNYLRSKIRYFLT